MKATGIVRRIDPLGRIVIPREIVKTHNIELNQTNLQIFVDGQDIILRKYEPACIFCGEADDVQTYKSKNICKSCLKEMQGI